MLHSLQCFVLILTITYFSPAVAIDCYQCQSTDHDHPYRCPEFFGEGDPDGFHLEARPCSQVHDAQYCIKQTGRFEGLPFVFSFAWLQRGKHACSGALGILCYQCDSAQDVGCSDALIHNGFTPFARSCEHVFEARFCIKTSGLYGGGLGTKRFCSSLDLGNYCNYVRQPGDDLEYRSCVYTCSSDGCNPAPRQSTPNTLLMLLVPVFLLFARRC